MPLELPDAMVDFLIRRKYRRSLYDTPLDRFTVRVAHTVEEHRQAFRLLQAAYDYAGFTDANSELRITPQHVLPEATVFVAYEGNVPVGTLTVTLDSAAGLPLDHDYGEQINDLRAKGARLVEYGSLMVVRRCLNSGVATLLNMAAHFFSTRFLGATHCVAGVNPRIVPFYRAIFAFSSLGERAGHAELEAEVQGMVQDLTTARSEFEKRFPGNARSGMPLVEHFTEELPPCIEMPPVDSFQQLVRWKLPREVFRTLFLELSDRVATLDQRTRQQLEGWRSLRTRTVDDQLTRQRPATLRYAS